MQDAIEPRTLASVVDDLDRQGFTEHFMAAHGALRSVSSGDTFSADEVRISKCYRFEGVSDPDDMSIVYAIETRNGVCGTLVDAFGVYSDPSVGEFVEDVPNCS